MPRHGTHGLHFILGHARHAASCRSPQTLGVMSLSITYRLVGTGWAKCVLSDDNAECEITASYLSDALGNLVLAALASLSGFKAVSFGFDEEPGEYRWVIEAIDLNEIKIELLNFDELWGNKPNADGELIFSTTCRPVVFARTVHGAATLVLKEHGEGGYIEKWGKHQFPSRQLTLLSELLALPHNAG